MKTQFTERTLVMMAMIVGLALSLPSVEMGFFLDDYAQLALLEDWSPAAVDHSATDLYSFLGELPIDPWWKHPDFKVAMWRPLTSALLQLDHTVFGSWAPGYHWHSLLWFVALLLTIALLYRQILPRQLAPWALLVFALDESHILTASWIANRHSMVAMVPALLGLASHIRWRQHGWRPGLPLSILGYCVALNGGEVALSILAFVLSYELFSSPTTPWRQRLGAALPASIVALTFAIAYKAVGFGAAHSGFYLDTGNPSLLAEGMAKHIPTLWGAMIAGMPADLWFFAPDLHPWQVGIGVLAIALTSIAIAVAWRHCSDDEQHLLRWLLPGTAMALLPSAIGQPFDRVLIAPMFGFAVVLGMALRASWRAVSEPGKPFGRRWAAGSAVTLLAIIHLLVPAVSRLGFQTFMADEWRNLRALATTLETVVPRPESTSVILPIAPDIMIAGFLPLIHGHQTQHSYQSWDFWSMAPVDHQLTRTGPRSLQLVAVEGELLATTPERFHRTAEDGLYVGDSSRRSGFQVEVLEIGQVGPTRLNIRFDSRPEDSAITFLRWTDSGRLEELPLPAIGETLALPHVPGPLEAAMDAFQPF